MENNFLWNIWKRLLGFIKRLEVDMNYKKKMSVYSRNIDYNIVINKIKLIPVLIFKQKYRFPLKFLKNSLPINI
jgi:hypothetical protein